jgi:hypothetical protein
LWEDFLFQHIDNDFGKIYNLWWNKYYVWIRSTIIVSGKLNKNTKLVKLGTNTQHALRFTLITYWCKLQPISDCFLATWLTKSFSEQWVDLSFTFLMVFFLLHFDQTPYYHMIHFFLKTRELRPKHGVISFRDYWS